jgi:uncharacterized lipoprotein YddW (UPF0748 family)
MDKRTFIKTALTLAAGSPLLGCNRGGEMSKQSTSNLQGDSLSKELSRQSPNLPDNWVWLRPDLKNTDDDWKRTFERMKSMGIDAVLPQIYGSSETLFEHPILPVKAPWLERIIPLAHEAGLEVHAWMWTMILNNPTLVEKNPHWFSVNRKGEPAHTNPAYVGYYKFMCPCNEEVAEFVAGTVTALAKIEDLDGIHLDYVRQPDVILAEALQPKYNIVQDKEYPEYDYPYSENCRNQFKEKHGIDPMDLGDEAPNNEAWRQFRYDAVSNIVNNYCVPAARKYGKTITAAVFPNWESVRQEWHKWDLDAFLPMLYHGFYNADINWIGEQVTQAKQRLKDANNDKPVFSGLYMPDLATAADVKKAIEVSKANGAKGVSFFEYGGLTDAFLNVLK